MGHFPIPTPSPLPKTHLPAQQVQRGHHTGGAAGCEGMKETGEEPTQAWCPDFGWKTIGKPYENGDLMRLHGGLMGFNKIYPLINIQKTMENHHF